VRIIFRLGCTNKTPLSWPIKLSEVLNYFTLGAVVCMEEEKTNEEKRLEGGSIQMLQDIKIDV
jgi:hypothetical protein